MRFFLLIFSVTAIVLLLSGCECVPAGIPPADDIVKNDFPVGELSPRKMENLLITALGLYTLQEMPGAKIALNSDSTTAPSAKRILAGIKALSGVKFDSLAPVELRSRANGNIWRFELFDRKNKMILWHEEFPVLMNEPN